jgi:hypothetical protein
MREEEKLAHDVYLHFSATHGGLAPGEFADASLQELYDTLVNVGEADHEAALGVGVLIERKDMTDILDAIVRSAAYPEIVKVYSNLLTGSEHHLEAFLKVLGEDEPGGGNGSGHGKGKHGNER